MNDATSIGQWVISAITVLSFIGLWLKLSRVEKREIGPQPFEVKQAQEFAPRTHLHAEYLTRAECSAQHTREAAILTAAMNRIENMLSDHARAAEVRAGKLHERIDPISQAVTAVAGRVDDHLADHRAGRT